ncbi:MAG TPA: hypothetical protein PK325_17425 [Cyclobacteriaceae bacterium]|nr:hypothetical protein [Cyclobacteriaceae bacterium]HMV07252.1 hypothetical protein [Cyclobacteriaceae bacterium]HMV88567.1 hypothetical protein [Cyclobacteriaceae bacterium]HMW99393.1 hypothetical protein [Cyclobacteriaceae bacterium]HMX48818.1 hypothetical protein [Cyclobacteriaceae bacterium]
MKPLFKYPATLLILLLVGYTQVFARAYQADLGPTPIKKGSDLNHVQAPAEKQAGFESYYFEEEENRRDDNVSFDFLCTDLSLFYFHGIKCASNFSDHLSVPFFFKSPLFRVLRL